jgi:flavin reductase (DIM6/NTAB) family NADH-FMN oxidoreductase RutF
MKLGKEEIGRLDRIYRLNLINSISGVKPANLIATRSTEGKDNVGIFSSVVHLGSNPALLGFVIRPQSDPKTDTYANIHNTKYYTINHVSESFIKKAHYTSAKLEVGMSEFDRMSLNTEFNDDFYAPFVKESLVKLGMKHSESIPLPNGCTFIIGTVELIIVPDDAMNIEGQLDLSSYYCTGISGLNTYYGLRRLDSFPYVRVNEIPDFE